MFNEQLDFVSDFTEKFRIFGAFSAKNEFLGLKLIKLQIDQIYALNPSGKKVTKKAITFQRY